MFIPPYNCCMNMQYIQIKEAIHMLFSLQLLYEYAIHPNKGSHTYVYSPYNCCMNMQYIQIKEAKHMFVLLTIAV